jgi:hypothetical protein
MSNNQEPTPIIDPVEEAYRHFVNFIPIIQVANAIKAARILDDNAIFRKLATGEGHEYLRDVLLRGLMAHMRGLPQLLLEEVNIANPEAAESVH